MITHDPAIVHTVLNEAWVSPFTTKSNFARQYADCIAALACMGWITVRVWHSEIGAISGSHWRVTSVGLAELERMNNA